MRARVVGALAREWPLTAKQVFKKICQDCEGEGKEGGRNGLAGCKQPSYQAVHKALKQLEGEKVVVGDAKGYSLNATWLSENKGFFDKAERKYAGKEKLWLSDVAENSSATMEFDSFLEAALWFLDAMERDYAENPAPDLGVICWRHPWPLSTLPEKDFLRLKKLMDRDVHYALCSSNNPFDCALMDFWEKIGKKPRLGVDVAKNCDEIAIHDYYIQYFLPDGTRRQMDALFKKAKSADGKVLAEYYKILYEKKEKTKVVIIRNQQVADRLREEALRFYK